MPRGWKGTVVSTPHSAQMASYRSRWYPPSPRWDRRDDRQLAHRFGSFVKPLVAKNSCSPTVKTKGVPQSTQVMVLSASSTGLFLNFWPQGQYQCVPRRNHNIIHVFLHTTTTQIPPSDTSLLPQSPLSFTLPNMKTHERIRTYITSLMDPRIFLTTFPGPSTPSPCPSMFGNAIPTYWQTLYHTFSPKSSIFFWERISNSQSADFTPATASIPHYSF